MFRLDVSEEFFTIRVVRQWNRLPREAVDALTMEMLKIRLDVALSNFIWSRDAPGHGSRIGTR